MERIVYFCRRHMMPLLLLPLLLSGCVDEFPVTREVPYGGDGKGLSVEEAKTFFESYVSGKASRSAGPDEHDNGFYIRRLMLPVGEFVPGWEEGLSTDAPSLYSVDVPVQSDFSFRVLRVDKGSGKVYQTKCWHKLVVVKDPESGNMGCFIAFFIPDRAYALSHGGDIGRVLTNGEEMGDYSGVKIYTALDGRRVRVNRYENGKKVEGIYIDGASDREDYIFRMLHSEKILGRVWLQRSRPRTPVSRGEDDWVDDFWDDWWYGTFDDDSWSDDSWSDDSNNDSDNPLDTNNDNFVQVGNDGWDYDVYYNSDDDTYYIDIDGDGFVDSAYVNDGYDESDSGDDWSSGDETTTPPDPDPLPDPGDAPTDSGEGGGGGSNSGETNNNPPEEASSKKTPEEIKSAVKQAVKDVIAKRGLHVKSCNMGVQNVLNILYGNTELNDKNANDIVRYWQSHPNSWEKISMSQAQSLANQGYLVVAGWINTTGGSGHVVVIVPGEEQYSGIWQCKVPNSMDTGENMRTSSQKLSYSFRSWMKDGIEFFKYK